MNFKKILSAAVASALSLSAAVLTASADTIGSASIYPADETWSTQVYWGEGLDGKNTIGIASVTPAEITGDGTYTTSVEFAEKMNYGQIFCLNSDIKGTGDSSFADYPNAEMSIVSVKADGKEVQGNASVQDINDNGHMKINILDPLVDASRNYVYKSDWTSGIKSVEVTFTVTGTGILPEEDTSSAEAEDTSLPTDEAADAENNGEADKGTSTDAEKEPVGEGGGKAEAPSDDKTEIPATGNAPISPIAAVTALAGVIAFMAKRK